MPQGSGAAGVPPAAGSVAAGGRGEGAYLFVTPEGANSSHNLSDGALAMGIAGGGGGGGYYGGGAGAMLYGTGPRQRAFHTGVGSGGGGGSSWVSGVVDTFTGGLASNTVSGGFGAHGLIEVTFSC